MTEAAGHPPVLGFSAFAKAMGWKPSYVTSLRHAGRLVLTDDNLQVRVPESLQRIADTRDPSKAGVADRHAAGRAAREAEQDGDMHGDDDALHAPQARAAGQGGEDGNRYQRARAAKEQYLAMQAKLDYEERIGKLVDAQQVRAIAADMGATVRRRLESLPTVLAAMVDERDRDRIHTLTTDHVEQTLSDLESAYARATARKDQA